MLRYAARWSYLLLAALLAGCANAPVEQRAQSLFQDQRFDAPSQRIDASQVYALSEEMRRYLRSEMTEQARVKGMQQALFDALFAKGELKLEYDSSVTRTAAEAFASRSGNCLSLVILTAAFAKELGLPVRYQTALAEHTWDRNGDVHFLVGHVNVTLGRPRSNLPTRRDEVDRTIDFLPPFEIQGLRARPIGEETILAMYFNNRAAETFTEGKLSDAYWYAREAIRQDPRFTSAYITLGVVYRRHGDIAQAERVLAYALERDPESVPAMANLVPVLAQLGRTDESKALARKLEAIEPDPPFSLWSHGIAALRSGDFRAAKDYFAKEVKRAPYYHEFRFWLAVSYAFLGEIDKAREQMALARDYSPTPSGRQLYASKLDRILSTQVH